jgi:signal transduction histidine kinase
LKELEEEKNSQRFDDTERKKLENRLIREQEQVISIFDSIDQVIYVTDPITHEILYINNYFNSILGSNPVGKICYNEFQQLDEVCDFCTNSIILEMDGKPHNWEYYNPILDRYFMVTDRIIDWPDGRKVRFEIAIDITANKKAEEELRAAQEQLVRNERLAALGQISGGVGHELRNPLAAIKNAVYYLGMVHEEPSDDIKETLDILNVEVANCERIIGSLLDYARPRIPTRQKVFVRELLESIIKKVDVPLSVEVKWNISDDIPTLLGDTHQLEQVFLNLIHNAIQAMDDKGELSIMANAGPTFTTISISDTGNGIEPEDIEKIFEPLFTTKAKGIGLGLAIVKSIVKSHKGEISVDSIPGEGSTFTVKLPKP